MVYVNGKLAIMQLENIKKLEKKLERLNTELYITVNLLNEEQMDVFMTGCGKTYDFSRRMKANIFNISEVTIKKYIEEQRNQ